MDLVYIYIYMDGHFFDIRFTVYTIHFHVISLNYIFIWCFIGILAEAKWTFFFLVALYKILNCTPLCMVFQFCLQLLALWAIGSQSWDFANYRGLWKPMYCTRLFWYVQIHNFHRGWYCLLRSSIMVIPLSLYKTVT